MGNSIDHEDTARLILMELRDANNIGYRAFVHRMRDEHAGISLTILMDLYRKYAGMDRAFPTHDIDTGERLKARVW